MIKPSVIFCLVFVISLNAFTQETSGKEIGKIGASYSFLGSNTIVYFKKLDGGASYSGERFFTFAVNYFYPLNKMLEIETGLEYSKHEFIVHPNVPPNVDNSPHQVFYSFLSIPLSLRVNFYKYFFINGGFGIDIDTENNYSDINQSGIGGLLGFGFKYDFAFGISLFLNPYIKIHNLISFSKGKQYEHILEAAIKFGVTYDL